MKLYPMYCVPCFMKHSLIVYPNVKTETFGYSATCPECHALVITRSTENPLLPALWIRKRCRWQIPRHTRTGRNRARTLQAI